MSFLKALAITLVFIVAGTLLTGKVLDDWYPKLIRPWFALPLWGWLVVGGLYYLISLIILSRLFRFGRSRLRSVVIESVITMMFYNEGWNYLLFGLKSPYLAFIALFPYVPLVVFVFFKLLKFEPISARILFPYLIWLVYDFFWSYELWKLNPGISSSFFGIPFN